MNKLTRSLPLWGLLGLAVWGLFGLAGCESATPAKKMPTVEAPKAPERLLALTLPKVKFADVTKSAGITFEHTNGMTGRKLLPETMGSGVAFLDFDNDGDFDLFFVNSCRHADEPPTGKPEPTQALFRNDGQGHFADVTAEAGLALCLFGQGVATLDYDNDKDADLFLTTLDGARLLRNEGGTFSDQTAAANASAGGGWLSSACAFDLENDGDSDLFVCRYIQWSVADDLVQGFQLLGDRNKRAFGPPVAFRGTLCTLLRNDGGTFVDVSAAAGVEVRTPDHKVPSSKALGVAPYDIDNDGFVDLAVANDTVPNFLFRNKKDGTFEEMGTTSGIAVDPNGRARGAMGIDFAEFRDDGALALAIGNFANEMTALYVSDDPTSLQFYDLATSYGLGAPSQPPLKFGLFFFDYDLDGRLDLLTTNGHLEPEIQAVQASQQYKQSAQLFWNSGQPGRLMFAQVEPEVAGPDLFDPIVGRGSSYADIDGDGDLDVVLTSNGDAPKLLRNDGGNANHWLRVRLIGTKSNRDGYGAKLEVSVGDRTIRRQHFTAKGYLSAVEPVQTFGLGKAEKAAKLTVRWPSGALSELADVKADQVVTIEEPR